MKADSFRFKFNQHLRGRDAFSRVLNEGHRYRANSLSVFSSPNHLTYCRIGIILPKKQVKRAVDRNYIKRLLKENFRLSQHQFSSRDFVIFGYRGLTQMTKTELQALVASVWQKLQKSQASSV